MCACVCACVYSKFPRECDITQHGPLLGELLLLPATPLLESMILHTHTIAPTEVTPTGPNFPLHLQPPAASQCVYVRACTCTCTNCLPPWQPIKSMLSTESQSAGAPAYDNKPAIKGLNLWIPQPRQSLSHSHTHSHKHCQQTNHRARLTGRVRHLGYGSRLGNRHHLRSGERGGEMDFSFSDKFKKLRTRQPVLKSIAIKSM